MVCKVQPPTVEEVMWLGEGSGVVSFLQPAADLDLIRALDEAPDLGVQLGPSSPDQPFPGDGRPLLTGDCLGLPRRAARSRAPAEVLPDVT